MRRDEIAVLAVAAAAASSLPNAATPLSPEEEAALRGDVARIGRRSALDWSNDDMARLLATLDALRLVQGDTAGLRGAAKAVVLAAKKHTPEIVALNKAIAALKVEGDTAGLDATREGALDRAWKAAEEALPLAGWADDDGRWAIPSGIWDISIRHFPESGDGVHEPRYPDVYEAVADIRTGKRVAGTAEESPAAALLALADRLRGQPEEARES